MSLMSVLFWRYEEAKWKPHVERVLHYRPSMEKSGLRNQLLVYYPLSVVFNIDYRFLS